MLRFEGTGGVPDSGVMRVLDGDRAISPPTRRGRALLTLWLLHAGEVASANRLIGEL